MAEVAALELQIGANVDKAVAGIQQFDKSLFQLQEELKTFKAAQETTFDPKQFVTYQGKINQLTTQIKSRFASLDNAMERTSQTTQRLTKTSASATNSMFALSGVVQDAPYGFRAIANNITFLAQEMAYTSKTSGGFKAALKGMAGAFIGPAGIIFAISAATSLLTYFLNSSKKTGDEVEDLKIKVGDLNTALLKGSKDAEKDAVNLDLLYNAATNVNKSMSERIAAVKELQTKYPKYLGNLSQEQILAGKAADSYLQLKNQIIATARAKAAQETIIENEKQRLDIEAKLQKLAAKRTNLESKITDETKRASSALSTNAQGYNSSAIGVTALSTKLSSLNKEIKETVDQYNQLTAANNKLSASVNVADLTTKVGGGGGGTSTVKTGKTDTRSTAQVAFVLNKRLNAARDAYRDFTNTASANIAGTVTTQFAQIGDAIRSMDPLLTKAQVRFLQFKNRLEDGIIEAAATVREGLISAISSVTQGFASGGFMGAAQALLSALGEIAIQLGEIAIGVGIGILGIKSALESLNPFAAIAAGVALIALGAVAKNAVKGIALAQGGIAYGPTPALVGEYAGAKSNPEVIAPLDKLKALIGGMGETRKVAVTGEFRLRGSELRATLKRADDANSRVN